jgi:hypothetical protein
MCVCESESGVKANPSMAARWFTSIFIPQSHTHALCVSSCSAARAFAAPPAVTAKTFVYCFSASQQLRKIYILVLRTAYIQFKNGVRFSAAAATTTRRHAASQRGTSLREYNMQNVRRGLLQQNGKTQNLQFWE